MENNREFGDVNEPLLLLEGKLEERLMMTIKFQKLKNLTFAVMSGGYL